MQNFFIKKGKKGRTEALWRTFLYNKACSKTKQTSAALIKQTLYNSIPFVKLKIRKKGKRIRYKVNFLEKENGEKKALLAISKTVNADKQDSVLLSLDKELQAIALKKSPTVAKRDELHKIALKSGPYSWRNPKRKLKKKVVLKKKGLDKKKEYVNVWQRLLLQMEKKTSL